MTRKAARRAGKTRNYRKAQIQKTVRPLVKVWNDDGNGAESSWAEHVKDNLYRSLNHTFSNVTLKLPKDHEHANKNGNPCGLQWGHLFEAEIINPGTTSPVRPTLIVGQDLSPRFEGEDDVKNGMEPPHGKHA